MSALLIDAPSVSLQRQLEAIRREIKAIEQTLLELIEARR
jgi:chorismate mutase